MKYLITALLVLLAPVAWAQKADHSSEKEIAAYRERHLRILNDVRPFIPQGIRPEDMRRMTQAEYIAQGALEAREELPRLKALIAELQAIPDLRPTGDPERDAALHVVHAESLRTAQLVQAMVETTIAKDDALRANDMTKVGEGTDQISAYSLEMQQSGTRLIRAGKAEPGSPAKHASIEGLALFGDGFGLLPQFQLGLKDAASCSKEMTAIAKRIREQAVLIRQEYAAHPGKHPGAQIHAARIAFPDVLERAATQFEITAFEMSFGAFDPPTALATAHTLAGLGLDPAYVAAWGN